VGKCKYKYLLTTCLQIYHEARQRFATSPIAFISHEHKQVVIQFLIEKCSSKNMCEYIFRFCLLMVYIVMY